MLATPSALPATKRRAAIPCCCASSCTLLLRKARLRPSQTCLACASSGRGPETYGERLGRGRRRVRCRSQQGVLELGAGADLELAIGVAQVHLDRLDRDE